MDALRMRALITGHAFTPADLSPSVKAWFDAASGITYQVNPSVSTWTSRVGSIVLTNNGAYPQFIANSINGLPALRNFSSSASMSAPYSETGAALTLAYVGSIANSGSAFGRYVSMSNSALASEDAASFLVFRSGTGGTTSTIAASRGGTFGSLNVGYETYFILLLYFDGTNAYLRINGTQIGTGAKTGNFNINRLSVWRDAATPGGYSYGAGNFAELFTMTRAPTATEQAKIEGYLAWKFGLTSLLPVGHAYKSVAPTA